LGLGLVAALTARLGWLWMLAVAVVPLVDGAFRSMMAEEAAGAPGVGTVGGLAIAVEALVLLTHALDERAYNQSESSIRGVS
jgi:hypothetical protein